MTTKIELVNENEKLLQGIQTRQDKLNNLSSYLSELESQLALIFAASPDIIVFLDKAENIVKISNAAFTVLGYEKEEMVNKSIWDFISPTDVEGAKQQFVEVREKKLLYFDGHSAFINHWVAKNGKTVKLMWRFSLCDDRENHTIGVASDVTHFGTNNIYNFKLLQKAVDLSSDGIVLIDNQQNNSIVYVNRSYEKMTGYKSNDLIDKNWDLLYTEDTKNSRALTTLNRCLSEGKNCDVLLEYRKKNGNIFYNRLSISSIVEHNIVVNFIGISRDITDKIGVKYNWSPNVESGFIHLK